MLQRCLQIQIERAAVKSAEINVWKPRLLLHRRICKCKACSYNSPPQIPLLQTDIRVSTEGIFHLLMEAQVPLPCSHNNPPLDPVLGHLNPVYVYTPPSASVSILPSSSHLSFSTYLFLSCSLKHHTPRHFIKDSH
jgi:hypothetical protein